MTRKQSDRYMREALERVIKNDGLSPDANGIVHGVSVRAAWEAAKAQGLLRRITQPEIESYIENRRGVRAVLLAMFSDATEDETRSAAWDDGRPSISTLGDRIDTVAFDIRNTRDAGKLWTLTDAGVARLEELNG